MVTLSTSEIDKAQKLINKRNPGSYELKTIYATKWRDISSPTEFGSRFKKSVEAGMLNSISVGQKKSNNHLTYKIFFD